MGNKNSSNKKDNMKYNIPGVGILELNTIVFDLNGTLAVRGAIIEGVKERIKTLQAMGFSLYLFSGDQRGNAKDTCKELNITYKKATSSAEKENLLMELDADKTVAIGNARIDIGMFKKSRLSIATIQGEGIHTSILNHTDIIVTSINDALDLFIDEDSLKATLRI